MRSFLPALALCAVLQPALAGSMAPVRPPAPTAKPVVMHASLAPAAATGIGPGAAGEAPNVVVAGFKADAVATGAPQPAQQEEHRPTTTALLVTAFLVMSGIALRRWGTGE